MPSAVDTSSTSSDGHSTATAAPRTRPDIRVGRGEIHACNRLHRALRQGSDPAAVALPVPVAKLLPLLAKCSIHAIDEHA